MKKVSYNEVPKEYRRDYKKEAVEFMKMLAVCFGGVMFFALLFFVF
jgi:hypothetical protein